MVKIKKRNKNNKIIKWLGFLLFIPSLIINIFLFQKYQFNGQKNLVLVAKVIDGDTFVTETKQYIRLANIEAPEIENCGGQKAKQELTKLINGKSVRLDTIGQGKFKRTIALIYLKNTLINKVMAEQGLVRYDGTPSKGREEIKKAYQDASRRHLGIFSSVCMSKDPPDKNCPIKGNISRHNGEKIYFLPYCQEYPRVIVEKDLGEKWFCSEKEAVKAGFTKANHCQKIGFPKGFISH